MALSLAEPAQDQGLAEIEYRLAGHRELLEGRRLVRVLIEERENTGTTRFDLHVDARVPSAAGVRSRVGVTLSVTPKG